jgi:hypothetical protein
MLQASAVKMDGILPGSLKAIAMQYPVVTLSVDGLTAEAL